MRLATELPVMPSQCSRVMLPVSGGAVAVKLILEALGPMRTGLKNWVEKVQPFLMAVRVAEVAASGPRE